MATFSSKVAIHALSNGRRLSLMRTTSARLHACDMSS